MTGPTAGFAHRFLRLAGGYWAGPGCWRVWLLTATLGVLTIGQLVSPIMLNLWSQRLFDALEQRSMDRFLAMVALAFAIIAFNIVNTILHLRIKRRLQYGWRQWLTKRLLDAWVWRGRHHQVTYLAGDHDNPDGRIAEDIRIATETAIELGLSLTYCVLLLLTFAGILWRLSGALALSIGGVAVVVPGYLVDVALVYAAAGTTIATLLGRPLVRATNRRQGYEADFRFALARVRENAQAVALLHGEAEERGRLLALLQGVRAGWNRQTLALSNVTTFSAAYSVLSVAFPILVAAPRYIAGTITLGGLMQTAQAFQQTASALTWPIDNLPAAAQTKASIERILGLHEALERLDGGDGDAAAGGRITVERGEGRTLSFQQVAINEPDGTPMITPFDAEVAPGDRLLIAGDPAAAARLFRAVARAWPWGAGRILLPADARIFIIPRRPYLPPGPLRGALSYPAAAETVGDAEAAAALARVGLVHLAARLDDGDETWKEMLPVGEQQRLGFARLLVRQADWIFLEDATDALDLAGEEEMLRLLDSDFAAATVVTIGNRAALEAHHRRKLLLERSGDVVSLREA
jgi:putative ATP-binding cassette transporter